MAPTQKTLISVRAVINAPVERVWRFWTEPGHIKNWNHASDDWHTTRAENDLRVGGKFLSRMEAKDGSAGFDFSGQYTNIDLHKEIEYSITDGRKVQISFVARGKETIVTETFVAEKIHSIDLQKAGWQAILDSLKKYAETGGKAEVLHFEIKINARVEIVFRTMIEEKNYNKWTSEFNPSSHYRGTWEKGSKILFIGTDQNGKTGGMVSKIKENIPNKFISIEHLGLVKDGEEITTGSEIEEWAGALENYSFADENGKTLLSVDVDSNEEFKSYFIKTWPRALNKLKEICEK